MKLAKHFSPVRNLRPGAICVALFVGFLTACGGSGSSQIGTIAPRFTSFATAANTFCVTPSSSDQNVAIPTTAGVSGSISFGAFATGATGCEAVTIATGSDVATTQSLTRTASQTRRASASFASETPLLTISIGAAFNSQPGFGYQTILTGMQLNVGSGINFPDGTYYATITPVPPGSSGLLTYTAHQGALRVASTGTSFPLTLKANTVSILALYSVAVTPSATPTPTASPTASPSVSPTPRPSTTPTAGPTPTATASHAPTPTPSASSTVYPLVPGASFTYQYSLTTLTTTPSVIQQGHSYVGQVNAQLSGLGTYNGNPVYTLHTQGTTTDGNGTLDRLDYVNMISASGHTEYVEFGYNNQVTYNDGYSVIEHDGTILTYATPFINDVLPEMSGSSWAEPVAISETANDYFTSSQNNPNILNGTITRNADGSYQASGTSYSTPVQRAVKSNGTGYLIEGPPSAPEQWSFGLPQAGVSGEVIPVAASFAGQTGMNLVPDWYPGGGQPSTPLATEKSTDLGQVNAPTTCATQANTVSTHIQTKFAQLDPAAGTVESDVTDLYVVPGVGFICKLDTDTLSTYDNQATGKLQSTKVTTVAQVLTSYVP